MGGGSGFGDFDIFQVFRGGSEAAVTYKFVNQIGVHTMGKLVGDESMAKIIDFAFGYVGFLEIAVNAGADIADKKRFSCFGNEKMIFFNLRPDSQVILDCGVSRFCQGNSAAEIVFQGADINFVLFDVFQAEIGQLGDANSGLKQKFDYGTNTDVQAASIA